MIKKKNVIYNRTDKSERVDNNKENSINKVKIRNKEQNHGKSTIKDAIEIEICPTNFNRENDWTISNAWIKK